MYSDGHGCEWYMYCVEFMRLYDIEDRKYIGAYEKQCEVAADICSAIKIAKLLSELKCETFVNNRGLSAP